MSKALRIFCVFWLLAFIVAGIIASVRFGLPATRDELGMLLMGAALAFGAFGRWGKVKRS
jgi:hypothetical protein